MSVSNFKREIGRVEEENKKFRESLPPEEADFIDSVIMIMAQAYANSPEDNGLVLGINEMMAHYTKRGSKQCEKLKDFISLYQHNQTHF